MTRASAMMFFWIVLEVTIENEYFDFAWTCAGLRTILVFNGHYVVDLAV